MIRLPFNWRPRRYQVPLYNALTEGGVRRAVAIWHRRAGKDETAMRITSVLAFQRVASYWHVFPEINQGRKAVWAGVNPHTGKRRIFDVFPDDVIEKMNEQEMMITFKNGSTWQLTGSDNYNSLVGSSPAGIVFSEWAVANQAAWGYLQPMLEENKGWALFITTPRGRNHAYDLYRTAQARPDWFSETLRADQTGVFTPEALAQIRADLLDVHGEAYGQSLYDQEYMCAFDAAIAGSIFGAEMTEAEQSGRIGSVPPVKGYKVHTAWDLGNRDATVIVFFQILPDRINVVDCYSDHYKSFDHYVNVLKERGYDYGVDFLPHDAAVYEGIAGRTRIEQMVSLGRRCMIVPRHSLEDGNNAARLTLRRAWFDEERCKTLIEGLRSYRRTYDEERRVFLPVPVHDWSSDYAAAFRYASVSWKERKVDEAETAAKEGLTINPKTDRPELRIDILKRLNDRARANGRDTRSW